jgi:hypothetical protein
MCPFRFSFVLRFSLAQLVENGYIFPAMPELPSWTARLRASRLQLQSLRWAALAWIVVFWRLGYTTFLDPDEAHYAQMTREMLHSGSWLVPLLDGHPYIDKPVLFHWLQGLSMLIFGETEFAGRLRARWRRSRCLPRPIVSARPCSPAKWASGPRSCWPRSGDVRVVEYRDLRHGVHRVPVQRLSCLLIVARGDAHATSRRATSARSRGLDKGPVALVLVGMFFALAWLAGGELRGCVRALHCGRGLLGRGADRLAVVRVDARPVRAGVRAGYVLGGNVFYLTQPESFSGRP